MLLDRLKLAKEAAQWAGERILKYYDPQGTSLKIKHKSPTQPVTQADLDANEAIKEVLAQYLVSDGWLSEEDVDSQERFAKDYVWIVDPLDGTTDFIRGNPEFTVSIGLVYHSQPVLGVIYNPVTNELFWASQGGGAYLNQKAISVRKDHDSALHVFVSRAEHARGEWQAQDWPFVVIPCGGSAYKLGLVASGRAHAALTFIAKSEWDICAGSAIIQEAEGIITNAQGEKLQFNKENPQFNSVFYADPKVHEKILKAIQREKKRYV